MVVNNLGGHGARNRVGTVRLGYKSPLFMRVEVKTNLSEFQLVLGVSSVSFHPEYKKYCQGRIR